MKKRSFATFIFRPSATLKKTLQYCELVRATSPRSRAASLGQLRHGRAAGVMTRQMNCLRLNAAALVNFFSNPHSQSRSPAGLLFLGACSAPACTRRPSVRSYAHSFPSTSSTALPAVAALLVLSARRDTPRILIRRRTKAIKGGFKRPPRRHRQRQSRPRHCTPSRV